MRARLGLFILLAAMIASVAPGAASADDLPLCDPATRASVQLRAPGPLVPVIRDRSYPFYLRVVLPGYFNGGPVQVTLSAADVFSWSRAVELPETGWTDALWIDTWDAPSTVTVEAKFREYPPCLRVLTRTLSVVDGLPMPRPRVTSRSIAADFRLQKPAYCLRDYAPTPMALEVRRLHTSHWTDAFAADQCTGWQHDASSRLFTLRIEDAHRIAFYPRTPPRTATHTFAYQLFAVDQRRVVQRGRITVRTVHHPARRIYAWNGNASNDEYRDVCVYEGKRVWWDGDNVYCVEGAYTERTVSLS